MSRKANHIIDFYRSLSGVPPLPEGVELLNPYKEEEVMEAVTAFYKKYTPDKRLVGAFGINPGRFGAGVTGIAFTDPVKLSEICGIDNDFKKKPELSSTFVYEFIEAFGGPEKFYGKFFLTAVCPLGFTREGKNLNYYDDKELLSRLDRFIRKTLKEQMKTGLEDKVCICLGEGKNFEYFRKFNDDLKLFKEIIPLAHPRYIMQYRRRQKEEYIRRYLEVFAGC